MTILTKTEVQARVSVIQSEASCKGSMLCCGSLSLKLWIAGAASFLWWKEGGFLLHSMYTVFFLFFFQLMCCALVIALCRQSLLVECPVCALRMNPRDVLSLLLYASAFTCAESVSCPPVSGDRAYRGRASTADGNTLSQRCMQTTLVHDIFDLAPM